MTEAGETIRAWEVDAPEAVYAASDRGMDFPDSLPAEADIRVAQWGVGYGWGAEAIRALA